jgi:tRNA G10  N-methylase Trm11
MIYFILGAQPELSKAEIQAVLGDLHIIKESETVLLVDSEEKNLGRLQDRLAGIVKVGHVIGELTDYDEQEASELIASYASGAMGKNKISYGLSIYNLGGGSRVKEMEQESDSLGGAIKKRLKEMGRPVRYVTGKEPRLSSAIIETNGLLSSGGEFVLLVQQNSILIGQTEAIQDFKGWSDRDYGRPARDKRSGMLPPKLARMMINLSGVNPEHASILDPFCGSGTVLMEGALMGADTLIGSDLSEKAISDTEKNMAWLMEHFTPQKPKLHLFTSPASELITQYQDPVDLIVTEVYLGPPRTSPVDTHTAKRFEKNMLPLYEESLRGIHSLLTSKTGVAVIAFPALKTKNDTWYRLPLKELISKTGYNLQGQYLYARSNQLVARDIVILTYSPESDTHPHLA